MPQLCIIIAVLVAHKIIAPNLHNIGTGIFNCGNGVSIPSPSDIVCNGIDDCGAAGGISGRDEALALCDSELFSHGVAFIITVRQLCSGCNLYFIFPPRQVPAALLWRLVLHNSLYKQ